MFKLNQFGFPTFDPAALDPKKIAADLVSVQPMAAGVLSSLLSALTPPEYVEDKNLNPGDLVDFLDADGCFVCKATVARTTEHTALVKLELMPDRDIVVRRDDLLKLVLKSK